MKTINLETGFGVLRDQSGHIISRLNLPPGEHEIEGSETVEEFETFEDVLALDWPPEPVLSLSSDTITADGQDTVTVTVEMVAESARDWGTVSLTVAGDSYGVDLSDGSAQQSITTTTTDASIPVEVEHPEYGSDSAELQVVQP